MIEAVTATLGINGDQIAFNFPDEKSYKEFEEAVVTGSPYMIGVGQRWIRPSAVSFIRKWT